MGDKKIIAYTYFLKWSNLGIKYYGVRYNKILEKRTPEEDFWIYYKGSSKDQNFNKKTGSYKGIEPDIRRIHKTFVSKEDALCYEQKFLKRVKAKYKADWLNKSDKDGLLITEDFCNKIKNRTITWKLKWSWKGKHHTEETKKKLSKLKKGEKNPFYGKKHSLDSLNKNRLANLYYEYEILTPEGILMKVDSLKLFCKEKNIGYSNMRQRNFSKGYKIINKRYKGALPWIVRIPK